MHNIINIKYYNMIELRVVILKILYLILFYIIVIQKYGKIRHKLMF